MSDIPKLGPGWTEDAPTEPGLYWFYGEPWFGGMGVHYFPDRPPLEPKFYLVEAHRTGGGTIMMVTEGSFIYPKRSPSQREYARGYWLAAHFPETPTDVSHLFAAGPEYVNDSSSNKPGPFQKVFPTVADEKTAEAIFLGLSNG